MARITTNGTDCNLPMVVHGQLLADCIPAGTADVCYPDGQTAQPCAAAPAGDTESISGLLQDGTLSQVCRPCQGQPCRALQVADAVKACPVALRSQHAQADLQAGPGPGLFCMVSCS